MTDIALRLTAEETACLRAAVDLARKIAQHDANADPAPPGAREAHQDLCALLEKIRKTVKASQEGYLQ